MQTDDLKPPAGGAKVYRVVEVVRDDDGRRIRHGRIWHSSVERARQFGRALAANSAADKVLVADSAGTVLEEVPEPAPETGAPGWAGWRELELPPLPARPVGRIGARLQPKPPAPVAVDMELPMLADVVEDGTSPPAGVAPASEPA